MASKRIPKLKTCIQLCHHYATKEVATQKTPHMDTIMASLITDYQNHSTGYKYHYYTFLHCAMHLAKASTLGLMRLIVC